MSGTEKRICPVCGSACKQHASRSDARTTAPTQGGWLNGQPADYRRLVDDIADKLHRSSAPLISGIAALDMHGQLGAWKLADQASAALDIDRYSVGRGTSLSMQRHGKVTASWGEICQRSDLVLLWHHNPTERQGCLWKQLTDKPSKTVRERKVITVVEPQSDSAVVCDATISLPRTKSIDALNLLRCIVNEVSFEVDRTPLTSSEITTLKSLAEQLVEAKYGSILYGKSDQRFDLDQEHEAVLLLTRDLNDRTRYVSLKLADHSNQQGAEYVLSLASGFPFSIDFHHSQARFRPLTGSANSRLSRGACDLVIEVAGDSTKEVAEGVKRVLLCSGPPYPKSATAETLVYLAEPINRLRDDGLWLELGSSKVALPTAANFFKEVGLALRERSV